MTRKVERDLKTVFAIDQEAARKFGPELIRLFRFRPPPIRRQPGGNLGEAGTNPAKSDRAIAKEIGVGANTVRRARKAGAPKVVRYQFGVFQITVT